MGKEEIRQSQVTDLEPIFVHQYIQEDSMAANLNMVTCWALLRPFVSVRLILTP